MATMDMIKLHGNPASFLDIGGSSDPVKVVEAMKLLMQDESKGRPDKHFRRNHPL